MVRVICVALMLLVVSVGLQAEEPGPVPEKLREELKLNRFYTKHIDAGGLPIVGSGKLTDNALSEAAWIVDKMIGERPDILKAMKQNKVRIAVMAATEYTTDIPEHSRLKPKQFWDRRARGLGATPSNPCVSCGEENLLGYPGDPYPKENIFVHEFAHAIHGTGLNKTDSTFDPRLKLAYQAALERGLWKNTYAASNHHEYWAEGVQCWFDDNAPPDALHNHIRTRDQLKEYDKELAKLCHEVFGDGSWRYQRPGERKAADQRHLKNYDPKHLPSFGWREVPVQEKCKVTIHTEVGDFDVELHAKAAPEAVAVFLKIALDGGYHSGQFYRGTGSSTAGTITAEANATWLKANLNRLKLPEVPPSQQPLGENAIALVRNGEKVASFVIVIGKPEKLPDNLIPIGVLTPGNTVPLQLLKSFTSDQPAAKPLAIRRVIRTE